MGKGPNYEEPIWTRWSKLNPWVRALDPSLHLGSSNHKLSVLAPFLFLGSNQLILSRKWCHVGFTLDLPLLGLEPSTKGHGSSLWPSFNGIALFHWTPDLGPSSEVALRLVFGSDSICSFHSWFCWHNKGMCELCVIHFHLKC
jgi:hypothetical protein